MDIDRIELRGSANQLLGIIFWTPDLPPAGDRHPPPGPDGTGGYVLECHTDRCSATSAHALPTDAAAELLGHVTIRHPQPERPPGAAPDVAGAWERFTLQAADEHQDPAA